jgi:DHA2 family multidrug resistance protein
MRMPTVAPAPPKARPLIAVAAVMLGTFTSLLSSRLTDIGLADIRGAMGLSFDEASWITTAFVTAEVTIVPAVVWLRMVFSPAPILLIGSTLFALLSLAAPFSPDLSTLLMIQALRGLCVGMLIPMTYGVVMRYIPQSQRLYALSIYALISGFTPNLSVFAEAFIVDHLDWRYLFWMGTVPAAFAVFGTAQGISWDAPKLTKLRHPDLFGLLSLSLGLAALVTALDQGNRLDWLESGLIIGLLLASSLLLSAFAWHSLRHPRPMVDLRILTQRNVALALSVTFISRFATMATAVAIPQFLIRTQGYRALETGQYFVVAALPQLVMAPIVAWLCYRLEPRNLIAFGALLFAAGVAMTAPLTSAWAGDQFIVPLLLQSVASAFLAVPVMVVVSEDITFPQIPWIATWVHVVRTVGTAIAMASINTLIRVREQVHSNLIGQHLETGDVDVQTRLTSLATALKAAGQAADLSVHQTQLLLARTVQREAYTLAFQDVLTIIAAIVLTAAISGLLMRKTKLPGRFF